MSDDVEHRRRTAPERRLGARSSSGSTWYLPASAHHIVTSSSRSVQPRDCAYASEPDLVPVVNLTLDSSTLDPDAIAHRVLAALDAKPTPATADNAGA